MQYETCDRKLAPLAQRELNLFDATMLVMGGIIGVGIFFTPRAVALEVPDPAAFLSLWAIGGAIALCGALTFAELGASFPKAGGWYVFLREGFGRFPAFLFAWITLFVVSTGAIAVILSFFADTVRELVPELGPAGGARTLSLGAALVLAITALSIGGVKLGALFQNACMIVKLTAIAAIVLGGWLLVDSAPASAEPPAPASGSLANGMVRALLPVLFACGGWQMLCYVAPQVRDPQRTLPRAIVIGILGVVAVYLAVNTAYLRVLGIEGLASDPGFASTVAERVFGPSGSNLLQVAMAVSALGVCTVYIVATPWLYVAMAREGLFFAGFAKLHPRTGAPVLALCAQAVICLAYWTWAQLGAAAEAALPAGAASRFVLTPGRMVDSVVFVEWVFHALAALALLRLRRLRPELPRPFASFAYPLAPLCYLLLAAVVVLGTLWQAELGSSGLGLALLALGAAVYPSWRRYFGARASPAAKRVEGDAP